MRTYIAFDLRADGPYALGIVTARTHRDARRAASARWPAAYAVRVTAAGSVRTGQLITALAADGRNLLDAIG